MSVAFRQPIRPGDKGRDILAVKRVLRRRGYKQVLLGRTAGPKFEHALEQLQRNHRLIPDGVYGPKTHALVAPGFDAWGGWLYRHAAIRKHRAHQDPPLPRRWPASCFWVTCPPTSARWGLQPALAPQVEAICKEFGLTVTAGWGGHPPHAYYSDHRVGLAVDLAGPLSAMVACNLWADALRGHVFRWVGGPAHDADGVEHGHSNHVHLSWYRSRPTTIFGTSRFK